MIVRPQRKPKPPHRQRRPYVNKEIAAVFAEEKPLPEPVWASVKKAVGIDGTFEPPKASEKK